MNLAMMSYESQTLIGSFYIIFELEVYLFGNLDKCKTIKSLKTEFKKIFYLAENEEPREIQTQTQIRVILGNLPTT